MNGYTSRIEVIYVSTAPLFVLVTRCVFVWFSVAPKHSGSYSNFQLLLVKEDPRRTNIGIYVCIGRTTDAPQVSWKTSPHKTLYDHESNQHGQWLQGSPARSLFLEEFSKLISYSRYFPRANTLSLKKIDNTSTLQYSYNVYMLMLLKF